MINQKTFKCQECYNIFPIFRKFSTINKLIDNRKYIDGKIVCKRCYYKIRKSNIKGMVEKIK